MPRYYPKKENFIKQLPLIAAGKKSKRQAMEDAGYSKSTAAQQTIVLGNLRKTLPDALRENGVNEQRVALKIDEGMEEKGTLGLGYTRLAASILSVTPLTDSDDAYPQKNPEELWQEFSGLVTKLSGLRERISRARQGSASHGEVTPGKVEDQSAQ